MTVQTITVHDAKTRAVQHIRQTLPDFSPRIAVILGSGLGSFTDMMRTEHVFPYADLPGFPRTSVEGHAGELHAGFIGDVPIVCLRGRVHVYEGISPQHIQVLVNTLKGLGCSELIVTNAAGSLRADWLPGSLMLIEDHINLQGVNPMLGPNDARLGPRFFPMHDAYDLTLRARACEAAASIGVILHRGVYVGVLGPNYETPAEVRAFRVLGGDAVGMSTVGEVLVARHIGLKVLGFSVITNLGSGLSDTPISHEETLARGAEAAQKLTGLVDATIRLYEDRP